MHIDIKGIWVRTRSVKGMNPADAAEHMLGNPRVKSVGYQSLCPLEQRKLLRRHNQMQKPLLAANRAIAVSYLIVINSYLKPHSSTVTPTVVGIGLFYLLHSL